MILIGLNYFLKSQKPYIGAFALYKGDQYLGYYWPIPRQNVHLFQEESSEPLPDDFNLISDHAKSFLAGLRRLTQ
jgi:hypothetical protein